MNSMRLPRMLPYAALSASSHSTSNMSAEIGSGICQFKTAVSSILPGMVLIALILFSLILAVGIIITKLLLRSYNKRTGKNLRLRDFRGLPRNIKLVATLFLVLALLLLLSYVAGIAMAFLAPKLIESFVKSSTGMAVNSTC